MGWDSVAGFGKGVGKGVAGAAQGTWEGLKGLAKGGYALATDAAARDAAWDATKNAADAVRRYGGAAYDDPAMLVRDVRDGVGSAYTAFEEFRETASPEQWGEVLGGGAFDVATAFVPVGAVAKVGKLGKVAKLGSAADKAADAAADAAKASKAFPKAKPGPKTECPTVAAAGALDELADLARRPGVRPQQILARRSVAESFFVKELGYEPHQVTDILKGIDLNKPLEIVDIPPPDTMTQFVRRTANGPGNWFNPDPAQTADMLGLNGDPAIRRLATYRTPPGKALKSVASPVVDYWTDKANPLDTKGGGIQMTVSNALRDAFTEL